MICSESAIDLGFRRSQNIPLHVWHFIRCIQKKHTCCLYVLQIMTTWPHKLANYRGDKTKLWTQGWLMQYTICIQLMGLVQKLNNYDSCLPSFRRWEKQLHSPIASEPGWKEKLMKFKHPFTSGNSLWCCCLVRLSNHSRQSIENSVVVYAQ